MSILIHLRRPEAMQLLEHSTNLLHHPIPRGGNSGKNPDPAIA